MGSAHLPERHIDFDDEATDKVGCFGGVTRRFGSGVLEPVDSSGDRAFRRRGSIEFQSCRVCRMRGHQTRDCPRKVKTADWTPPNLATVRSSLKARGLEHSLSVGHSPVSDAPITDDLLFRVDEEPLDVNALVRKTKKEGLDLKLVLNRDKGGGSPCTPVRSPQAASSQPSSPFMNSSLSGSSNRESPFSTSSRSRYPEMLSPFSMPSDVEEPFPQNGEYSPTVELPHDSKPSRLDGLIAAAGEPSVRPIERWRSLSLSEFDRLTVSSEDAPSTSQPRATPTSTPSPEAVPLEKQEWSDFDKYGIDIDLFVGSCRLPPADLLCHSGILQPVNEQVYAAMQNLSSGVSRSSSSGSASALSRQTTTTRDEIEPAEGDKWPDPHRAYPSSRTWSVGSQSFGREDSLGPSDGGSWRHLDDEELSIEAPGAEHRADWTDQDDRNGASPASSASSGWRHSSSQGSRGNGGPYYRTRYLTTGSSPTKLPDRWACANTGPGGNLSPSSQQSQPKAGETFPRPLSEASGEEKGEGKKKGKRTVIKSLKRWLSGPIEIPPDIQPLAEQR